MQDFGDTEDPPSATFWDLLSFVFEEYGGRATVWFLISFLIGVIIGPWMYLPIQLGTVFVLLWLMLSMRRERSVPAVDILLGPMFITATVWLGLWAGIELTLLLVRIFDPSTP